VQIGALHDGMRVIEQGLNADDRVVIEGLQRAIPGSKVAPREASQTTPATPGAEPAPPATTAAPPGAEPAPGATTPAAAATRQPAARP